MSTGDDHLSDVLSEFAHRMTDFLIQQILDRLVLRVRRQALGFVSTEEAADGADL